MILRQLPGSVNLFPTGTNEQVHTSCVACRELDAGDTFSA